MGISLIVSPSVKWERAHLTFTLEEHKFMLENDLTGNWQHYHVKKGFSMQPAFIIQVSPILGRPGGGGYCRTCSENRCITMGLSKCLEYTRAEQHRGYLNFRLIN